MAFSSKARSAYTQLMLTHIDARGNDWPAIIVDHTTAANRGVNIPEFVNMPQDGIARINPEAAEYYRRFNQAYDLMETNRIAEGYSDSSRRQGSETRMSRLATMRSRQHSA